MEENKNVQTVAELSDEELEQTAGGVFVLLDYFTCPQCGREYGAYNVPATCTCGKVLHR